jgi:hypothetical protein
VAVGSADATVVLAGVDLPERAAPVLDERA